MTKSLDCNEVLPESNVELEGSYQTKHKKLDKDVDSQVNRLSKNNEDAVKKETQNIDVNSVEKKMNNERTIVGDSIIKHVNDYEILGKLENCKVFVRPCHGTTIRCKTGSTGKSR